MTKKLQLPCGEPKKEKVTLPFNGNYVQEKGFSFSFSCFDRNHKLFNLGGSSDNGTISSSWFLDLLDCLKSISNKTISELKGSVHDLHPIDFTKTNTNSPIGSEQLEYWQFRINKSKGRVIGLLIDGVFYITWLVPYHNLTNSDGYGNVNIYKTPKSAYELQEDKIEEQSKKIKHLEEELKVAEELLDKK